MLTPRYRAVADAVIVRRLLELPETGCARQILTYLSLPDEPCIRAAVERVATAGLPVFAPRVDSDHQMTFVRWLPSDGFHALPGGKWHPSSAETCTTETAVALVPGRAFDLEGVRVGRGRGFYDRVLGSLRAHATLVGVAYECQVFDQLPRAPHDEQVDFVVTEMRTHRVRAAG